MGVLPNSEGKIRNGRSNFKDAYSIMVLADIGGGTIAEANDSLIGVAAYLEAENENRIDDLIIEGIFPEIPMQGSSNALDKIAVRKKGIDNLDDAAAVIKPALVRIENALPEGSTIRYKLSQSDWRNIKTLKLKLKDEFLFYLDRMKARLESLNEEIINVNTIIKITEISLKKLNEQMSDGHLTEDERARLIEEKNNAIEKIGIRKMELKDLKSMFAPLEKLYLTALAAVPSERIKKLLDNAKEQQKAVMEELEALKEHESKEYLELSEKAKRIANTITRLNKRYREVLSSEEKKEENKRMRQSLLYTHNALPEKQVADLIEGYVLAYYKSLINDAFGRRRKIIIQNGISNESEDIWNSDSTGSFSKVGMYKGRINGEFFNVILLQGASHYSRTIANPVDMTYRLMQNGAIDSFKIEEMPLNVVISTHNTYSSFTIEPITDRGSLAAALVCGPLWDVKVASGAYNHDYSTEFTNIAGKAIPASGVNILRVKTNGIEYEFLTSEALKTYRATKDIKEAENISQVIEKMKKAKSENIGNGTGHKESLDIAVLKNKLPSEFKDEELANSFVNGNFLGSLIRYGDVEDLSWKTVKIGVISDTHIGNFADLDLLDKVVARLKELKPEILILPGDLIEGNYNNYKNVPRMTTDFNYHAKVEEELRSMGVKEDKIKEFMDWLIRRDEKRVIQDIEEQASVFADHVEDLIYDVLNKGGSVIIVSGNHYNNTAPGWQFDEAKKIESILRAYIKGRTREERAEKLLKNLKSIPGSESGGDIVPLNYNKTFLGGIKVAHDGGGNKIEGLIRAEEKERLGEKTGLLVSGHYHQFKTVITGNKIIITAPAMQESETNPYLERIGIPKSDLVEGGLYVEARINNNEIKAIKTVPLLKEWLSNEFDALLRKVNERIKTANIK